MRYTDLLRLAGSSVEEAHQLARIALLPYIRDGRDPRQTRAFLRSDLPHDPGKLSGPKAMLLDVPKRLLKRWATRALSGMPRTKLLKGPCLAMFRQHTPPRDTRFHALKRPLRE